MYFIKIFLITIMTGYISLTTTMADGISTIIDYFTPAEQENTAIPSELFNIPSLFSQSIPDLLRNNRDYQQAAVAGTVELGEETTDPLEAIVNLYCTYTTPQYVRTTTGTGFFVSTSGVIMTNAHVAQFFLLEDTNDGETECTVRGGDPASPQYHAELLYISPAWVQKNAGIMNSTIPTGTGERDYALLYVSSSVNGDDLPEKFPALHLDTDLLPTSVRGRVVTAAGYPAGERFIQDPHASLSPLKADTAISELYTFGSNHADVFSIKGSQVGAEGASGGPVVNKDGDVIGMIVTKGDDNIDGSGSLRAITLSHVESTITEETGLSLKENIGGDLAARSQIFKNVMSPFLLSLLDKS